MAALVLALITIMAGLVGSAPAQAAHGREFSAWGTIAQGKPVSAGTSTRQQPCMQLHGTAPHEWAAIAGSSSSAQLHHQGLIGRGRSRFQPDTQAVLRLIRERQDAIIAAWTHRMRDASEPGESSHTADRPLIVTRPLRGPPARG
jgi:hypothetical protein